MPLPQSSPTVRHVVVPNTHGIHCRPSAVIARKAAEFPEHEFLLSAPEGETDLRSVIGLIGLGIECGSEVTIQVAGPDQDVIADQFAELFATHFDFPPRDD